MKVSSIFSIIATAAVGALALPTYYRSGDARALQSQSIDMQSLVEQFNKIVQSDSKFQSGALHDQKVAMESLIHIAEGYIASATGVPEVPVDVAASLTGVLNSVSAEATKSASVPSSGDQTGTPSPIAHTALADSQNNGGTVYVTVTSTAGEPGMPTSDASVPTSSAIPAYASSVAPAETTSAAPVETTSVAPVETTSVAPVETTSVAPVETTSVAPVETTSVAPVETTSAAPAETTSSGSSEAGAFAGDGTFYTPGLGSCGQTNSESDLIAAINAPQYGDSANPNLAPVCGRCALVKGPKGSVKVRIVDRCPVCKSGDIDLSPAAFQQIGEFDAGRIPITWSFVSC